MKTKGLAKLVILLAALAAAPSPSRAAEFVESWTSVRALGMGNAYSALVDNADALFYNPAGLCRVGGFNWTIMDPRAGLNGTGAIEAVTEFSKAEDYAEFLNSIYGENYWIGAGAKSAITLPCFGIAAFGAADVHLNLSNPAYPTMNLRYYADYGLAGGFGFGLVPGIMTIGFAGRRLTRMGTDMPLGPSILGSLESEDIAEQLKNRGTGYAVDTGFMISIPAPVRPTLSFAWKNVGYTTFSKEAGTAAPPRIEPEMVIGGALEIAVPLLAIRPSFDYKHLNNSTEPPSKKVHMGVEISVLLIDIRAGFHQGYYTLGAGLDLGLLRVDAATYGVELGEYAGQHEDRRYVVQATMELGFDASTFSFGGKDGSGKGGGRRRLKQRR